MDRSDVHDIEFTLNGEAVAATVPARRLLIHFLRDDLDLLGPKIGCDTGHCGACTILYNGRNIKSCMMLAVQADGADIKTIEGLSADGELTPVQQAFHEHHALQCGYCTSGMVISASYLLEKNPSPSAEEIREGLRGNLCRCTGYVNIVEAVAAAAGKETSA